MARLTCALAGLALVAEAARVSRHTHASRGSKTIAGVPVLNYDQAYGGRARAAQEKEHWVVFAKKGVDTKTLERLCSSVGACEKTGHPDQGGVPFFEVHTTEERLAKVLATAETNSLDFIEPDGVLYLDDPKQEELEPAESRSWGLDTVGVSASPPNTGGGSHIYVLDTGVRVSHFDFDGRATPAADCSGGSLVECGESDTTCASDVQGHGTHCAGSAGGRTFGVAPEAFVHGIKVLSDQGTGDWSWSYEALDFVATKGQVPRVSSMSLGGQSVIDGMKVAIDQAVSAGVVVVVAGGNSNMDSCKFSPAYVPNAITVGSTTRFNHRSSFSNFGSCTNIWAPGTNIVSAGLPNTEKILSGTSMACPHVSGAVALQFQEGIEAPGMLATLQERAGKGYISGLKDNDVNYLLWVGAGDAPIVEHPCRRRLIFCWE